MTDEGPRKRTMKFQRPLLAGAVAMAVAVPAEALLVMKVDAIAGESTLPGFEGQIELLSYAHGVSRTVTLAGRDLQASRLTCGPVDIAKLTDIATPKLFALALGNATASKVEISEVLTLAAAPKAVSTLQLENVRVSLAARSASGESRASESYSLQMAKWRLAVQRFDEKGMAVGAPEETGYDCTSEKSL